MASLSLSLVLLPLSTRPDGQMRQQLSRSCPDEKWADRGAVQVAWMLLGGGGGGTRLDLRNFLFRSSRQVNSKWQKSQRASAESAPPLAGPSATHQTTAAALSVDRPNSWIECGGIAANFLGLCICFGPPCTYSLSPARSTRPPNTCFPLASIYSARLRSLNIYKHESTQLHPHADTSNNLQVLLLF